MTCLFTVLGPRQHVFKSNDSKIIDLGQKGTTYYSSFSPFNSFFHCQWSPVLHNFELIRIWKVFQNNLRRLIFARIGFARIGFLVV